MAEGRSTCAERNTAHVTDMLRRIAVVIDVAGGRRVTQLHRILLRSGRGFGGRCGIVSLRRKRNVA
jgi:hypothetical protein